MYLINFLVSNSVARSEVISEYECELTFPFIFLLTINSVWKLKDIVSGTL